MELAMSRVKGRVQPQTWEAFHLSQIETLTPEQVATKLGIKLGSVYVARTRVRQLLMDELDRLDTDKG